jgi:hypothetical protein
VIDEGYSGMPPGKQVAWWRSRRARRQARARRPRSCRTRVKILLRQRPGLACLLVRASWPEDGGFGVTAYAGDRPHHQQPTYTDVEGAGSRLQARYRDPGDAG